MANGGIRGAQDQGISESASQGIKGSAARITDHRPLSIVKRLPLSTSYRLLLVLIIVLSGWWRAVNLDAFGVSNDEGTHLMWARLANEGYSLYSQTWAVQGPFFISLIQLSFKLLGTHVASGRWMGIGLGLVTLLGVGLLARRIRGWTAAWVAAATLSVAPLFFQYSRIVRGDVAASAFLVLALLSAYAFQKKGRRVWLGLSGLLLSAHLLVKAVSPLAIVLILLLILQRRLRTVQGLEYQVSGTPVSRDQEVKKGEATSIIWRALGDVLIFGLGLTLPVALCFVVYDSASLFNALITFRLKLRATSPWNPAANFAELSAFLGRNAALAVLSVYGWLSLLLTNTRLPNHDIPAQGLHRSTLRRNIWWRSDAAVMGLWLVITFITLIGHTPLFTHHLISLLLPMAVLAGVAVEDAVQRLVHWRAENTPLQAWGLVGLALIGFYVASLPAWLGSDQHAREEVTGGREADAIKLLRTITAPGDFVISDNQMLPFMADRLSPPPLGDIALVAIRSGQQTTERLITLSHDYQVEAIITWSHRLPWLPDYLDWVEENYLVRRAWDDIHIIYFGRRMPPDQVPNRVDAQVGDSIELLGYDVGSSGAVSEQYGKDKAQTLDVTLYWRAGRPARENYTVFVHLLDPKGQLVTQHDGQPLHGYLPTGDWSPGDVIPDRHHLPLPADLSAGHYRLITGMYTLETLERLPVHAVSPQDSDNSVTLTVLEIEDQGIRK